MALLEDARVLNAEAMLKTFYGRRRHDVSKMSTEELLQCALIHASLVNASSRIGIEGRAFCAM